jgi:hypothetical protein
MRWKTAQVMHEFIKLFNILSIFTIKDFNTVDLQYPYGMLFSIIIILMYMVFPTQDVFQQINEN